MNFLFRNLNRYNLFENLLTLIFIFTIPVPLFDFIFPFWILIAHTKTHNKHFSCLVFG